MCELIHIYIHVYIFYIFKINNDWNELKLTPNGFLYNGNHVQHESTVLGGMVITVMDKFILVTGLDGIIDID